MSFDQLLDSPVWESVQWLGEYLTPGLAVALSLGSFAMLVASMVVTPWLLVKIPANYFLLDKPPLWTRLKHSSPGYCVVILLKNAVGVMCVAAGILMLVLPGQGLLTILVGIFLLDFHGKKDLERKLVSYPKMLKSINWLRRRYGREDLDLGESSILD